MTLELSRSVEEIIATRVFITASDGFLELSALGSAGEGGIVQVGAKNIRLASDAGFLHVATGPGGDGEVCLRTAGDRGAILLTTPGTGRTARLRMRPDGVEIAYGNPVTPGRLRLLDDKIEMALGADGPQVVLEGDTLTLAAGGTRLVLGPGGIRAGTPSGEVTLAPAQAALPNPGD